MLHVLPKGLHKIRYFGFFANCHRQAKLAHCRTLLGQDEDSLVAHTTASKEDAKEPGGEDIQVEPGAACPVCRQGHMQLVQTFYRHRAAWDLSAAVPQFDTS